MNKSSLVNEIDKLRNYVKRVQKDPKFKNSTIGRRTAAYTITGMIEVINTYMATGAYNIDNDSLDELFDAIESARTVAIHYQKSDTYKIMVEKANDITKVNYDDVNSIIAEKLDTLTTTENDPYILIHNSADMNIVYDDSIYADCFRVSNNKTHSEIYVPRTHLAIVENKQTGDVSYLIKLTDDKSCYCKITPDTHSIIASTQELKNAYLFEPGYVNKKLYFLDTTINKIIKKISEDPYNKCYVSYNYNNKTYASSAYNLLNDYYKYHSIDEKVALTNKYSIKAHHDRKITEDDLFIPSVPIEGILKEASLKDLFFTEYFLKEAKGYFTKIKEAKQEGIEVDDYTRMAQLLQIYKNGPNNFSDVLINASDSLKTFYYNYKDLRNALAHTPLNDEDRHELIDLLENYMSTFFDILNPVYSAYSISKVKHPFKNLPKGKELEDGSRILTSKTYNYNMYKHTGETIMIGKKKYLRLANKDPNNLFIQIDGVMYLYNYLRNSDCLSSYKCLASSTNANIVQISKGGVVSKYNKSDPKCNDEPISYDNNDNILLETYDYLKSYPQANNRLRTIPSTPIITYYNLAGANYSEPLRDVMTRKYHQHFICNDIMTAKKCKLPKNIDEPIEIYDDNDNLLAKVYYGNIKKDLTVTQVLQDGSEIELNNAPVLPKTLDISNILEEVKLERDR